MEEYAQNTETLSANRSPHVRESRFRNLGNFRTWNPESWALEPGKQLKESGIPQAIGILNPSSTEKDLESGNWNPESRIHDVESRIQDCLGFLYMGRNCSCTMFDVCELLAPFPGRCCSNYTGQLFGSMMKRSQKPITPLKKPNLKSW